MRHSQERGLFNVTITSNTEEEEEEVTDTKGRHSSSLTFLLTGHLAEGVLTKLLDTKDGNSDTFTSSSSCLLIYPVVC